MKLAVLAILASLSLPTAAHAFNGMPGHADIVPKAIKKGGCVTGCKVSFKVRNAGGGSYATLKFGRAGLYKPEVHATITNSDEGRNSTFDEGPTAKFFMFKDIATEAQNQVYDGEIDVDYAAHGLKSGDKITLVTSWKYSPSSAPHVYGAVTQTEANNTFVLP